MRIWYRKSIILSSFRSRDVKSKQYIIVLDTVVHLFTHCIFKRPRSCRRKGFKLIISR